MPGQCRGLLLAFFVFATCADAALLRASHGQAQRLWQSPDAPAPAVAASPAAVNGAPSPMVVDMAAPAFSIVAAPSPAPAAVPAPAAPNPCHLATFTESDFSWELPEGPMTKANLGEKVESHEFQMLGVPGLFRMRFFPKGVDKSAEGFSSVYIWAERSTTMQLSVCVNACCRELDQRGPVHFGAGDDRGYKRFCPSSVAGGVVVKMKIMNFELPAPAAPAPAIAPWPAVAQVQATPFPTMQPLLAGSICATATSCGGCTALPECGWCGMEQKCVQGSKLGPQTEQCLAYDFMTCANIACDARNTCTDCVADRDCGWCASKARCTKGDGAGPYTESSCPAPSGFAGARPAWAHALGATQCQDTPQLHSKDLWDNLRGIMYSSRARIARMQAKAAVVPPPPLQPAVTAPPPVAATPMPQYVTYMMPPGMSTDNKDKKRKKDDDDEDEDKDRKKKKAKVTSTAAPRTPCPTQTVPLMTPPPAPREPPIEINVNVDQDVRNKATAGAEKKKIFEGDTIPVASAPAAVMPGSPGFGFGPAPAGPGMLLPPPPGGPPPPAGALPPPPGGMPDVPIEAPPLDAPAQIPVEAPEVPAFAPPVL